MTPAEQDLEALRQELTRKTPEEPISPTLAEMNQLADEIARLRDQEKSVSDAKKLVSDALEAKEQRVVELLIESGANSYRAPSGLLSLSFRLSARLPQSEHKKAFFEHLKAIGRFDDMVSVSSPTFTAFVKEQYELARENNQPEPRIPGVTEVKMSSSLSFRRTR